MTHNKLLLSILTASCLFFPSLTSCLPKHDGQQQLAPDSGATNGGVVNKPQTAYRTLSHGVHPGSADGDETMVEDIDQYTRAVGKEVAFVYFSQELNKEWLKADAKDIDLDLLFPHKQIKEIRKHMATPFIRLMVRSTDKVNEEKNLERLYSYDVLLGTPGLKGDDLKNSKLFHDRLVAWGVEASKLPFTIYVEWGTEVNGKWFWWNGQWYAQKVCENNRPKKESEADCMKRVLPEASMKFQAVFRHLRQLINVEAKASNVRWIFHVTAGGEPQPQGNGDNSWNSIAKYYPAGAVDAIGLSVYGAQEKSEQCADAGRSFLNQMKQVLGEADRPAEDTLKTIAWKTPIYVLEFGETLIVDGSNEPNSNCNAAKWAREALEAMFDAGKWGDYNLAGFSWWNEAWIDSKTGITDMRVHDFQLCNQKDKDDKEVHGMRCNCWRGATEGCDNLGGKRSALRESLKTSLRERCRFLLPAPDSCPP